MKNRRQIIGWATILAMAIGSQGCGKLRESRAENLRQAALEHFAKGDPDKALEVSEIAIRLGADGVDLRGMRGSILMFKRKPEKALTELDEAIILATETEPSGKNPSVLEDVYNLRANTLQVLGRYGESVASYEKAIEIDETAAGAHNNIAWLLATGPDDSLRDGNRAIKFAERACELTEWENPAFLDTLAAAYAEADDFKNAVKWQKEAKVYLDSRDTENQAGFAERLRLYSQELVYRQDPRQEFLEESK